MRDDNAVAEATTEVKTSRTKLRTVVAVAALVFLILLSAWGVMYLRAHRNQTVEVFLGGIDPTLSVLHPVELIDRAGGGQPFGGVAVRRDGEDAGVVYTMTVGSNGTVGNLLSRLAGSASSVTLAVYIDESNFIRRMECLKPIHPTPFDAEFDVYLSKWKDIPANNAMWDNPVLEFGEGGGFGPGIRARLRDMAGSAFIVRYGMDRYMSELILKGARGLKVGELLPEFTGTAADGSPISTAQAQGHKLIVIASQPTCGACFDATVLTMSKARGTDVERVVIVFGNEQDDRTRALVAALDKDVKIIIDPEKTVARQLYVVNSPWVVLVDSQGIVKLTASGYETDTIGEALRDWLTLP